ncbi:UDP-N-acetylglucosamine--N-acetylmuramyl-(pentapeptide) pyrophosphoryl-undecaprenol N-acetylglucosamine transferase [hydrothermal vent metagenome]|uniref:UDP-N-acetylglucosamine--N-acetylmuramyl-(Pentapeptide) pyrophosphoryl-undecaprenol N-acetylglucosamine transferase n=1 Tax=hydrothermal vent metagenome TaxID=652676 RepID=A0A3B1C9H2_9ZZZZ
MNWREYDMKLLITGGGTGGHVYPGIAVARELMKRGPEHKIMFVGAEHGVETRIAKKEGFDITTLDVTGIKGKGLFKKAVSAGRFIKSVFGALDVINRFQPDVTLGVGGYASGPVATATAIKKMPLVLAEQNISPGITNKWLARFASKVFITWPESAANFPEGSCIVSGNPIRQEFFEVKRERDDGKINILVIGGSQGAASINKSITGAIPSLNEVCSVISITHQTGEADENNVCQAYKDAKFNWIAKKFFDDMPQKLADADLVISRAGAGAVAEICAAGKAAIYVPYPYAADDHQTKNAIAMENAGAAIVVKDKEITGEMFAEIIKGFVKNKNRLKEMALLAKDGAKPHAAAMIVDEILRLAREAKAA